MQLRESDEADSIKMDAITVSGWVMTALSLALAIVQTYRVKRLAKRNKEQLEMFIEDAGYVSFEHELLDDIAHKLDDPMLSRFLVSSHQRGCDLYRSLVDFYLSSERRFTYADLKRVCHTTLITYRWQEEFWKARVAMRPENRETEVPSESFLPENRSPRRFRALQARDAEQVRGNVSGSGYCVSDHQKTYFSGQEPTTATSSAPQAGVIRPHHRVRMPTAEHAALSHNTRSESLDPRRRTGASAEVLRCTGMPRCLHDLHQLRPRAAILQSGVPRQCPPAAAQGSRQAIPAQRAGTGDT